MCCGTINENREAISNSTSSDAIQTDRRKKAVKFAPRVRVRKTLSHRDYSDLERKECWYEIKDFERFKRLNNFIGGSIIDLRKVSPKAPKKWLHKIDHSSRGIEHLCCSNQSGSIKRASRLRVIENVLEFQSYQTMTQQICPEKLSRVSMKHSAGSRRRSMDLGKFDEQSAQEKKIETNYITGKENVRPAELLFANTPLEKEATRKSTQFVNKTSSVEMFTPYILDLIAKINPLDIVV
mmetsp:Transcript_1646/g.1734  ORF Transcript_1646/g.1734 Transcript_1646/m.1734 type:complete len:238 (-) Transcript_1646:23-736(-)